MHSIKIRSITLMLITFFGTLHCQRDNVNIGIFLQKNDDITEMAFTSATNIINYGLKIDYKISPLFYKINKDDIYEAGEIACKLLNDGVVAFFGPDFPEINALLASIATTVHIPQFQIFPNPDPIFIDDNFQETYTFYLHPTPYDVSKALATLVRDNDWKSYTIVYEDDDSLIRLQEVLKTQNHNEPVVMLRKLGKGSDHRPILKQIKVSGAIHIILDLNIERILQILTQAKEFELMEEYHSYLLTPLDVHILNFSILNDVRTNITAFRMLDSQSEHLKKIAKNWEIVKNGTQIKAHTIRIQTALYYDAINLFISALAKLDRKELSIKSLSCENHDFSTFGPALSDQILKFSSKRMEKGLLGPMLTGPLSIDMSGRRNFFKLQIIELKTKEFRMTGEWNSTSPDDISPIVTSEDREKEITRQIKGKNFRVVSRIGPPYLFEEIFDNGEVYYDGYAVDLIDGICEILHCNYTFEIVPDNKYGSFNSKTKEWDGLIKHLLDRKADLAVCDLTITYERRKAVDFTNPFMTLGISILYAKAAKEPPELLAFTKPLSLDVWLYMATAYLLISMFIYLVARLNPNDWENPHPCDPCPEELENIWNIRNCFWLTLGSIMQQGCDLLPKGIATRMVAAMWWLFTLIIIACYTANMTAFLTMERMDATIDSAEDLAMQSKIKYGCVEKAATYSFFKTSNASLYHRMWVQMESSEHSVFETSNADGVKRVLSSKRKYAFLMESSAIEYEMQKHCDLVQVGEWLDTKGYGIAMPTDAVYRTAFNQAILQMQENGKLKKLKEKWWIEKNKRQDCKGDESASETEAPELTLYHVGGVFVVLMVGIGIALTFSVIEFLWNVKKVAVREHMPLKEAFRTEMKFAMDIWARKKMIRHRENQ